MNGSLPEEPIPSLLAPLVRLVRGLRRNAFISNAAVLISGSAASAALGILGTPFLSRIYRPEEFGVLGVFVAALSIFSVVATLRYDRAIPAASDDREAASILMVALASMLCTSTVCLVLVLSGGLGLVMSAARDHARLLAWSLPLGMAATGTYEALSFWMVRRRDYRALSLTKVTQGSSMLGSQIGLGWLGAGPVGLVIGQIAGSSMGIARLARRILATDRAAFGDMSFARLSQTALTYRRFPLLSGPAVLLDALSGALPTLVVAHRFGPAAAGVLTIVYRVLFAPLALITTNLGQIFFGELAEMHRTKSASLLRLFYRRVGQVVILGLVLVTGMVFVVPLALPAILGPRWGDATPYFLILSPMMFAGLVSSPFSFAVDVLHRQDLHFLRDFLRVSVLVVGLGMASHNDLDTLTTLRVISTAGCINGAIYLAISWYAFAAEPRRALRESARRSAPE
ncbi:N/A [soil metagenome]